MEEDVVLADEVELPSGGICPPFLPGFLVRGKLRPLDGRGEIPNDRLEPDIQAFSVPTGFVRRDRNAPIQIPRNGPGLEALGFDLAERFPKTVSRMWSARWRRKVLTDDSNLERSR